MGSREASAVRTLPYVGCVVTRALYSDDFFKLLYVQVRTLLVFLGRIVNHGPVLYLYIADC